MAMGEVGGRPAGEAARPRVLFVSYDGMREPLGESQVLPYLRGLATEFDVSLLSFEKRADTADRDAVEGLRVSLLGQGIRWRWLRYHRSPTAPATAYDFARGSAACIGMVVRHGVGLVHARGYIPAAIARACQAATGAPFVFDMRGFWPEEKLDAGAWAYGGALYRAAKRCERSFLDRAAAVVVLTEAARAELGARAGGARPAAPTTVVPTCVDLTKFKPGGAWQPGRPFVLGYVGSVGGYYLLKEVLAFYEQLRSCVSPSKLVIVNRGAHDYIRAELARCVIPAGEVEVVACPHDAVPVWMAGMHGGVCFTRRTLSHAGTAPTRVGEMLACGVPCVVNPGMGDTDEILAAASCGVIAAGHDSVTYDRAARQLVALAADPMVRHRCAAAARANFDLGEGVERYRRIYRNVLYQQCPKRRDSICMSA